MSIQQSHWYWKRRGKYFRQTSYAVVYNAFYYDMSGFIICFALYTYIWRLFHLYLAEQFEPVKWLLIHHANVTKFDNLEQNELYGLNTWIVHIVGAKKKEQLIKVLKNSPLRFDSHMFEFFETDESRLRCYELNILFKDN